MSIGDGGIETKLLTQVLPRELVHPFPLPIRRQGARCFQRVSMERMMGLEPTTFCMASTGERFLSVPIWLC